MSFEPAQPWAAPAYAGAGAAAPRSPRPALTPLRSALSAVLLVIAMVLAPAAAVTEWARASLTDTDRFVAELTPAIDDARMQDALVDRLHAAITGRVDLDAIAASAAGGTANLLELPPEVAALLSAASDSGAHSAQEALDEALHRAVQTPQIREAWSAALRVSHTATIRILGDAWETFGVNGQMLVLDLQPVTQQLRQAMLDGDIPFASLVPEVPVVIPLASSQAIALTHTGYAFVRSFGIALVVAVIVLLVAGVLLARVRGRSLAIVSAIGGVTMLLGIAIIAVARGMIASRAESARDGQFIQALSDIVLDSLQRTLVLVIAAAAVLLIAGVVWWAASARRAARMTGVMPQA